MKNPPAFQFYPNDFIAERKVASMTLEERGMYITLLCYCWQDGELPDDMGELADLCGTTEKKFSAAWDRRISRCFERTGSGSWVNPRMRKEMEKQEEYRQKQAEYGKKGAIKRWEEDCALGEQEKGTLSEKIGDPISDHWGKDGSSSSSSSSSSEEIPNGISRESAVAASPPAPASPPESKWTEEDMANAIMLRDQLLRVDPAYVQRAKRGSVDLAKWADEFRLIRERDMRQQADIEFILTHFPRDGFWAGNIRSPGSLRGLTKSSGKDKFLTILASVQQSVRQNGQSRIDYRNGAPKEIPAQFKRPILELEVARRGAALRKLGLDPEHYDLERLVPR